MTSTSRRRGMRLAAALGTGALLAGSSLLGAGTATAQDDGPVSGTGQSNIDSFGACIAADKSANVLLILDQSASLKGFEGDPATDPDNVRVDATRDLVKQFQQLAADSSSTINVKLAGFGQGYHNSPNDYGDWVNVGKDADKLEDAINGFDARNEDMFTDYEQALAGASSEFAGAPAGAGGATSDCQAVIFFSDGVATSENHATKEKAAEMVCTPSSPLVGLRNSGIHFFTAGLIPEGSSDNPRELLEEMAEGPCGGGTPNGAYVNASNPAELIAAFRGIVPSPGSVDNINTTPSMKEPTKFTLDNSIDRVRLTAAPTSIIDGQVTPVLTAPGGEKITLAPGDLTVGDATVHVEDAATSVNGDVTAELSLKPGGDWAGEWSFGYDAPTADTDKYKVNVTLSPGLSVSVDELNNGKTTGLKSDGELHATLVDSEGNARRLDGEAEMSAAILTPDGNRIELGEPQSAKDGTPVTFSLDKVTDPTSGKIEFTTRVTTRAADNAPGSPLSPVSVSYPVTVTPVNMPTIETPGSLTVDSKETTVEIPVTGPGKVWVAPGSQNPGDAGVALPSGVGSVEVSSPHSDAASALELAEGEQQKLPVTLKVSDLADGRISVSPQVHLVSANGDSESDVTVPLSGNMTSPVNTGVFIGALIGVLLAAILIPLAVLYLMKLYTGRIPSSPGIHAVRVPVKVENGRLIRTDRGGNFQVGFDELMGSGRVVASGRDVNLAGVPVHVKLGVNPLAAPTAMVDAPAPSISDEGQQVGTQARLPLAVHNHWFVLGTPGDPTHGEIVLAVDEYATEGTIDDLAAKISTNGPELLERLAATPAETPGQGGKPAKQGGKRRKRKGADPAPVPPTEDSIFGNGVGPFDGQSSAFGGQPGGRPTPFGGPSGGQPTPFGGPTGPAGPAGPADPGTSGGGWGSNPGNGNGGPSPFGN